jgi:hypothetical protein
MASRPKFTPATFDELAPIRESFLVYLAPKDAKAFRRTGQRVFEAVLENSRHLPGSEEPVTVTHLRAIANDLEHCRGCLLVENFHAEASDLPPASLRLALRAAKWACKLEKIIADIDAELAAA